MNRIALLLIVALSFTFTGCIDVIEKILMNKDGSGKYTMTMDMSTIMSQEMRGMIEMMMQQQGEEGDNPFGDGMPEEMDSMFYFKDVNPEAIASLDRPEVFEKAYMHIQVSQSKELFLMEVGLDFKEVADIDYFNKKIGEIAGDQMGGAGFGPGMFTGGGNGPMFGIKGKKLTRYPAPETGELPMSEEEMGMMRMMFMDASYKTEYVFPKKVKKTSMVGAEVEGNTLTLERPLIDIIEGKGDMAGWIKFK